MPLIATSFRIQFLSPNSCPASLYRNSCRIPPIMHNSRTLWNAGGSSTVTRGNSGEHEFNRMDTSNAERKRVHLLDAHVPQMRLVDVRALVIDQSVADQHAPGKESVGRQNIRNQLLFRCGGTAHGGKIRRQAAATYYCVQFHFRCAGGDEQGYSPGFLRISSAAPGTGSLAITASSTSWGKRQSRCRLPLV